jgi:hypothetical protein
MSPSECDRRRDELEGAAKAEHGYDALMTWIDNLNGIDQALLSHRSVTRWTDRARVVDGTRRRRPPLLRLIHGRRAADE